MSELRAADEDATVAWVSRVGPVVPADEDTWLKIVEWLDEPKNPGFG